MKSLEYFRENSLPTPKVEEWKYFDLGKISKLDFSQSRKIKKGELLKNLELSLSVESEGFEPSSKRLKY